MIRIGIAVVLLATLALLGCRKEIPGNVPQAESQPISSQPRAIVGDGVILNILQGGEIAKYKEPFEEYARQHDMKVLAVMCEPFLSEHKDVFDGLRSERADVVIAPFETLLIDNAKLIKMLLEIDVDRLKNYQNITASIRTSARINERHLIDGKLYGVPFEGDVQTLFYNKKRISSPPDSYAELWLPEHKNRIATMGYLGGYNVGMTVVAMGYNPNAFYDMDADRIDWDKVKNRLFELASNSRIVFGNVYGDPPWQFDYDQLAECDFLFGWGNLSRCINARGGDWKIVLPKEGSEFWLDDVVIGLHLADQPEKLKAAYLWIDFLLSDEMQIRVFKDTLPHMAPVSSVAMRQLRKEGYDDQRLDENFFANPRLFMARNTDKRTRNYYKLLWGQALEKSGKVKGRQYLNE